MNIAVFGGTFDPPHLGHQRLIENIMREIAPDKLIVIPAYVSPFKSGKKLVTPACSRLAMCRLAFGDIPGVEISDMEIKRGGSSYSYDTIMQLRRFYPDARLYLIVGSDQLLSFRKWYKYGEILKNCALIALSREETICSEMTDEAEALSRDFNAEIILLREDPIVVSSTQVRAGRLDMVAPAVAGYIREKKLYEVNYE